MKAQCILIYIQLILRMVLKTSVCSDGFAINRGQVNKALNSFAPGTVLFHCSVGPWLLGFKVLRLKCNLLSAFLTVQDLGMALFHV